MSGIGIVFFTLISVLTIDILLGQLQKYNRETSYFKSPGLLTQLYLALAPQQAIYHRNIAIKRFFIALFGAIILVIALNMLLGQGFYHQKTMTTVMLSLAPLMAMPFYHFLFGILGTNPIAIFATIRNFRLRGMLAIIMSANIIFFYLSYEHNLFNNAIHFFLSFSGLVYIFYLATRLRAKRTPNNNYDEDNEVKSVGFMHYLVIVLEFFYYSILLFFVFLQSIINIFAPQQPLMVVVPIALAMLYITTIIIVKLLFIERSPPSLDFYEIVILPLSFFYFCMAFLYQTMA